MSAHIDHIFSFNDVVSAHQYMKQSRTVGKVIISM
ncbi:hypothetical protein DWX23_03105 [Parabacteroides sp. AF18-52]|nr:hypothetical protein DWX23_03105 [Parabacteroides sp. AF18-52]